MTSALVGYTGFVGSNLASSHKFDYLYNSKNIEEAYNTCPDLLVYSGVPSAMFIANNNPEEDLNIIKQAIENIKKINAKKLVLISTVAVYSDITTGDEDTLIDETNLSAYGRNRLYLEKWVENNINDYLIIRLPALYGINLKKNFIYDYIHFIPKLLKYNKFEELLNKNKELKNYYIKQNNGFYSCRDLTSEEIDKLKSIFKKLDFNALNFTDSRSVYQFFNLKYLWDVIVESLNKNIKKLNIVTEPLSINELYFRLENKKFINEINDNFYNYNLHSKYGYFFNKKEVLDDIYSFIKERI